MHSNNNENRLEKYKRSKLKKRKKETRIKITKHSMIFVIIHIFYEI